ncbi:MAG: hypothetical protein FVQ79_13540 [Planctomycetes bacterium]|nr:hypothetical protein [Planctomycetota bacterium]
MKKTFLMLVVLAFAGFGSFVADAAGKELKDIKLNYKKLACERLYYGISFVPPEDNTKGIGKLLAAIMINEVVGMSVELEAKVNDTSVIVDSDMRIFGSRFKFTSICKKDVFLTPRSITMRECDWKGEKVCNIAYKDGMLEFDMDGEKVELEYPEGTVCFSNLLRIVPQLPKNKDVRYEFDGLFKLAGGDIEKPKPGARFAIVYTGKEDIRIDGGNVNAHRYDLVDTEVPNGYNFYVDSKGLVRCVKFEDTVIKLLNDNEVVKLKEERKEREKAAVEDRKVKLQDIHGVISVGDNEDIAKLLDKDPLLVNKTNDEGQTPLHVAICQRNLDAVKLLVKRGADMTAVDGRGEGVMFMVWDVDTARYLIEKSPQLLQKPNQNGRTPLHGAVISSMGELVKLYIEKGADVNVPDKFSNTPLETAEEYKMKDIVELLKKHGAIRGVGSEGK